MTEPPKRTHDEDWDVWYVRADIADEDRRQRNLLMEAAKVAVGSAHACPDSSVEWIEALGLGLRGLRAAVAECGENADG